MSLLSQISLEQCHWIITRFYMLPVFVSDACSGRKKLKFDVVCFHKIKLTKSLILLFLSDTDAWSQDLQTALWEQTPQVPHASWAGRCSGIKECWLDWTWTWVSPTEMLSVNSTCCNQNSMRNISLQIKKLNWLPFSKCKHNTKNNKLLLTDTQWPRTKRWIAAPEVCWWHWDPSVFKWTTGWKEGGGGGVRTCMLVKEKTITTEQ